MAESEVVNFERESDNSRTAESRSDGTLNETSSGRLDFADLSLCQEADIDEAHTVAVGYEGCSRCVVKVERDKAVVAARSDNFLSGNSVLFQKVIFKARLWVTAISVTFGFH